MSEKNVKSYFKTNLTYLQKWDPESDSYSLGKRVALIGRQLHKDIVSFVDPKEPIVLNVGAGKGKTYKRFSIKGTQAFGLCRC